MITELHAKNFGCLRDVTIEFGGLHALIGPNDSGKSTILRALRTLSQLVRSKFTVGQDGAWEPFDPGFGSGGPELELKARTTSGAYTFLKPQGTRFDSPGPSGRCDENLDVDREASSSQIRHISAETRVFHRSGGSAPSIKTEVGGIHYFAFSEEGLRSPSGFLPKDQVFLSERGEGLPGLYFALRNDREEGFERILKSVRTLFPTVKTVRTQPRSTTELELEVELVDGTRVRASHVSTGLLYYLAFVAIPEFFGPASTILLEEPENGLHPARIREVLSVLRKHTEDHRTQVILTTHSPLVVNELRPEEVSVVTRPSAEKGTVVTPIGKTANFEKRSGVYALGELWLSYADGNVEEPLFDPEGAMKVFFAGEGSDELGDWAHSTAYRPRAGEAPPEGGILHALAMRFAPAHEAIDGTLWKKIKKYRAGDHRAPETRNVLGLALRAEELECDALVFVRDRDRDDEREADVERGIAEARERFGVAIVGGTANEEIEAWLLAMLGEHDSEKHGDAKTVLRERHGVEARTAKTKVVEDADLDRLPPTCHSLHRWIDRAKTALSPHAPT